MSDDLQAALRTVKAAVERDGSPVIYLHDPDTGIPFAFLMPEHKNGERPMLDAVEEIMVAKGWNPYTHSHIDGDD